MASFIFPVLDNRAMAQSVCTSPDEYRTAELTYSRISDLPITLRFYYKVTVPCNGSIPSEDHDTLYMFNPDPSVTRRLKFAFQFDSLRNDTGSLILASFFPHLLALQYIFFMLTQHWLPPGSVITRLFPIVAWQAITGIFIPMFPAWEPASDRFIIVFILNDILIPPLSPTFINSAPKFTDLDTILNVCTSDTLNYYAKAIDPDGDSVAYHFGAPKNDVENVAPGSPPVHYIVTNPPFPDAIYNQPQFSAEHPLGDNVSINPVTGLVKGTIADTGTYYMTVYALEYRNGSFIDSVSKSFVVRAFNCKLLPKPTASIPGPFNSCNSFTVNFTNNSIPLYPGVNFNNTTFLWNFGDGDTSTAIYPSHTYSDTGNYRIRLIVFPGLRCADTTFTNATIYPYVNSDFTYNDSCSGKLIQFTNTSVSSSGAINGASWKIGLSGNDTVFFPSYNASYDFKTYNKSYPVILTVTNDKGCVSLDTQYVNIYESPPPLPFHDTIISFGATLQLKANDGYNGNNATFLWTPSSGLSNPNIADPILTDSIDGTYYVSIKNNYDCTLMDSVKITYYKGPDVYVPNAFTPNGDGLNDIFLPVQVGISKFYYFRVFNRWGQLMFETNRAYQGWDGRQKTEVMHLPEYMSWKPVELTIKANRSIKKDLWCC